MDTPALDIGPLTWVLAELRKSYGEGLEGLRSFVTERNEAAHRQACKALHQANGALEMMGLEGLVPLGRAIDRLAGRLDAVGDPARALGAIEYATHSVLLYLAEAVDGQLVSPLVLFQPLVDLHEAGAEDAPNPADLYVAEPRGVPRLGTPSTEPLDAMRERKRFERGLLLLLRSGPVPAAVGEMDRAIGVMRQHAPTLDAQTFWYACHGVLQALTEQTLPLDLSVKRLLAQINAQFRRETDGQTALLPGLLRQAAFQIARATPGSPGFEVIRAALGLPLLPESLWQEPRYLAPDLALTQRIQQQTDRLKQLWSKVLQGESVEAALEVLAALGGLLRQRGLQHLEPLLQALARRLKSWEGRSLSEDDPDVIDAAACLLQAERLMLSERHPDASEHERVRQLLSRLQGKATGSTPPAEPDLMRQHEQQSLETLAAEMAANLATVEHHLDRFFRDPGALAELDELDPLLAQVAGVLAVLGYPDVLAAIHAAEDQIDGFRRGRADPASFEQLAESLGCVGFFFDLLRRDPEAAQTAFRFDSVLGRLVPVQTAAPSKPEPVLEPEPVPELEPVPEPAATPEPEPLLPGEPTPEPAPALEQELASEPEPEPAPVPVSAHELEPEPEPEPVLRLPTVQVPTAGEVDAELLEIFLAEADEVLADMAEPLAELAEHPDDVAALQTLRRGFHTLKGSGRMVGLDAFGAAAWQVEQTLNERLGAAAPVCDASLLQGLVSIRAGFLDWLASLHAGETPVVFGEDEVQRALDAPTAAEPAPLADVDVEVGDEEEFARLTAEFSRSLLDMARTEDLQLAGDEPAALAAPIEPAQAAVRRIGSIEISESLFEVYLSESDSTLARLESGLEPVLAGAPVAIDAARAAHAIAGTAATVGLEAVHDLAFALESYLQAALRLGQPLEGPHCDLLAGTIDRLRAMLHAFAGGMMPEPDSTLMSGLDQAQQDLLETLASTAEVVDVPEDMRTAHPVDTDWPLPPTTQTDGPAFGPELGNSTVPALSAPVIEALPDEPVLDDVDVELLPEFLEEGRDGLAQLQTELQAWREQPDAALYAQAVLRTLHTLKGSARMTGAMRLGQRVHELESLIEEGITQDRLDDEFFAALADGIDAAGLMLESLPAERAPGSEPLIVEADAEVGAPELVSGPAPVVSPALALEPSTATSAGAALLRVRADLLDTLVSEAGEISIARSRVDNELAQIRHALVELTDNLARLRGQLREVEMQAETQMSSRADALDASSARFDPLEFDRYTRLQELTRLMAESVEDVATVQQSLLRGLETTGRHLSSQGRMARDLQQGLLRVRMVPFRSMGDRLYRVARQTGKETGKRVTLDIDDGQVEIDRSVLERMAGPFEHVLRNAIVHGIEPVAQRQAAGKPEQGGLSIRARQDGAEVIITLADDGAGLDLDRIRARAVARGLLAADADITPRQLADFIFHPGFSTVDQVSTLAGRGVGMDVVRAEVGALGGRVDVESEPGRGCRVSIYLPLTLATVQVVLLRATEELHAVPATMIEQVLQLRPTELVEAYRKGWVEAGEHRARIVFLPALLGEEGAMPLSQRHTPVAVVRSGNDRLAVHVDEIAGNQEVVVKNIGPQISRMVGISGASILASGEIVVILNPIQLLQRAELAGRRLSMPMIDAKGDLVTVSAEAGDASITQSAMLRTAIMPQPSTGLQLETVPIVLVVDDSLTVRRVTQRLLQREGYQVVLAKDGVDALEQLQDLQPDVILTDIEMPRMDGFDFTRNLRADARFAQTPVIMITSRTAEKHRRYALEIGVNVFMGKPYAEEALLEHIAHFVQRRTAPASA